MSKKIGCGGFRIDDDTLKLKDDGTLYAAGGGGGSILEYEITETWDSHGNAIYSCELPFYDAYAMEEQKLLKSIKYASTNPSVVKKTRTSVLGEVIVLKFETYIPNSDMTVTVTENLFIWLSDGLHKATRKTS